MAERDISEYSIRLPERRPKKAGILHLGMGNFHRAHQAVYTAVADDKFGGDWGIVGVASGSHRVVDPMRAQGNLYTVLTLDPEGSTVDVINIHTEVLIASEEMEKVLDYMANPDIKIISLTVTEDGYSYSQALGGLDVELESVASDLRQKGRPKTVMGQLVEGLHRRFLDSAARVSVLSCDNLADNGRLTKDLVREFSILRFGPDGSDFLKWMSEFVSFPSTMVDRIVPATESIHVEKVGSMAGIVDNAPVPAEPFTMWVLEDNFSAGRPKWEANGAIFVENILPYELLKLRILNASNSCFSYLGLLSDLTYIAESAAKPLFRQAVEGLMREDMLPTFELPPEVDIELYIEETFRRFQNLEVGHRTSQVGSDGSSKLAIRLTEPVLKHHQRGSVPQFIALLAALYMRVFTSPESYDYLKTGRPIDAKSGLLEELGSKGLSAEKLTQAVFIDSGIFPSSLAQADKWLSRVSEIHSKLENHGLDLVINEVLILGRAE